MPGYTAYRTAGDDAFPSPNIWADCPFVDLLAGVRDGAAFYYRPFGATADTIASAEQRPTYGPFSIDCDDDTVASLKSSEQYGYLDLETDGDDNDAVALFTEPLAKLVKDSGNQIWLEARLEIGDADGDQGFFFGLAEEAACSRDIVADNAGDLITETLIGFRLLTGEDAIDCVAQKDDGSEDSILADCTDADSLGSDAASLADNTEMRLGLRFDGKETVEVYVDGTLCAEWTLDSDYYDSDKALAVVLSLKTGTDADYDFAINWVRYACLA